MMRAPAPAATLVDGVTSTRRQLGEVGQKVRNAPRPPNLIERRMSKFLREPPSIRMAASVIVTATTVVVVGGGIAMRILDHREYPSIWVGMWWALQTVTTVGYGDVTPKHTIGRFIAAVVMLEGIAFLAIITAAITSSFVARAQREQALVEGAEEAAFDARIEARFEELAGRFDQLEAMLREQGKR
jgi:voltage-gated potassium channel Kch